MISELINYLLEVAKKHKLVRTAKYKRHFNINDQNNHKYYQFIIDDENMVEKQVTEGILTYKTSILILGFVKTDTTVLEVQENALHIGLDWMQYLKVQREMPLQIRDFSILSFSEYSDDNSAGVKLDIQFVIPEPTNLCTWEDNFSDKEEEQEEETNDRFFKPITLK